MTLNSFQELAQVSRFQVVTDRKRHLIPSRSTLEFLNRKHIPYQWSLIIENRRGN